ncbi:MAG: hypothetical protein DRJ97_02005 [Thermoprotei archaeon]|nr:MAG: hypothetical protein DRJ97_02005 [Thermoprotei archaeon]
MKREFWRALRVAEPFTASYIYEILLEISKGPKRFVDLKEACPNEKTRSKRLKELLRKQLIKAVVLEDPFNRPRIFYVLTEKGDRVLSALRKLREVCVEKG